MPTSPPKFESRAQREAKAAKQQANAAYNAATYDSAWRRASKRFLRDHPLCRACMVAGKIREATETDHVVPIKQAPERRMDETNWQPLCSPCHSRKTWDENQQTYRGR